MVDWRLKAATQVACSVLPGGDQLYTRIQRRFGNLQVDPSRRLGHAATMVGLARRFGRGLPGSRVLELGTGHVPSVPLFLSLAGAQEVVTVDLNRRMPTEFVERAASALLCGGLLDEFASAAGLELAQDRVNALRRFRRSGTELLHALNIYYRAPMDAGSMTSEPDGSYQYCVSVAVLEHINPANLRQILREEVRLLGEEGHAIHLVDLADHYASPETAITTANFLKFSDRQWALVAGNRFGYCNRLRAPEVLQLFDDSGFEVLGSVPTVDQEALRQIRESRFDVDPSFAHFKPEDLATSWLDTAAWAFDGHTAGSEAEYPTKFTLSRPAGASGSRDPVYLSPLRSGAGVPDATPAVRDTPTAGERATWRVEAGVRSTSSDLSDRSTQARFVSQ